MIKFIAFSDMRCRYADGEQSHIAASDAKKIDALCDVAAHGYRFIASLGDTVDGSATTENSSALLNDILNAYDSAASVHSIMGERDSVITKREFMKLCDYAMRYRAFDVSDYRCIFLDTCIGDTSEPYTTTDSNRGFIVDDEQLAWLSRLLEKTHRPAIIFSHAPLAVSDKADEKFLVKNSGKLRELIEKSKKVALVVSGHMDKPDRVISHGVPYITLAPMYKSAEATFAKISVSSSGIEVEGFGEQETFSIENINEKKEKCITTRIKSFFTKYK